MVRTARRGAWGARAAVIVGLGVSLSGAPAGATVFFQFNQTSAIPADNQAMLTGWLALSDDAYAQGGERRCEPVVASNLLGNPRH